MAPLLAQRFASISSSAARPASARAEKLGGAGGPLVSQVIDFIWGGIRTRDLQLGKPMSGAPSLFTTSLGGLPFHPKADVRAATKSQVWSRWIGSSKVRFGVGSGHRLDSRKRTLRTGPDHPAGSGPRSARAQQEMRNSRLKAWAAPGSGPECDNGDPGAPRRSGRGRRRRPPDS